MIIILREYASDNNLYRYLMTVNKKEKVYFEYIIVM